MAESRRALEASFLERLPLVPERPWLGYGFAVLASLAALLLRWEIHTALPPGFPFLTFFPAVILTAFLFGVGPGVLAGVISGLAAWYFFVSPMSFAISYGSAVALGFYAAIVTVDIALIHWMQRANAILVSERRRANTLATTREALFQELQHRVGNNLQMIASLISLQSRGISDPGALSALRDASRRLALVGRIQRTLYSADGEPLALAPYIEAIARDTIAAAGRDDIELVVDTDIAGDLVEPGAAIPAALAVAEAVSNAIEHGLPDRSGTITLIIREAGAFYTLAVGDDGVGLPEDFLTQPRESLGLRIARTLAASLGGSFEIAPGEGGCGVTATIRIARDKATA